jgi:hypothetical protein
MNRDRLLVLVSAAELAAGVAGMTVALKRRRAYHVPLMHGSPDNVARDSVVMGTALSAPITMLVTQAVATVRLARGDERARRRLGGLGATYVSGYLAEELVRSRLRRSGFDAVETPLVVMGIGLAAAMAALGLIGTSG